MRKISYLELLLLLAGVIAGTGFFVGANLMQAAMPQAPKTFQPTEVQQLRLELKMARAQLAHDALNEAQQNFYKALTEFNDESRAIVKANNWPDTVIVNPKTLEFSDRPLAPAAPAPEVKPSERP